MITKRNSIDTLEAEIAALEAEAYGAPQEDEGNTETAAPRLEEEAPVDEKEKTYEKRYADLRRHSQKQADDLKREIEDLKRQVSEGQVKKATEGLPSAEEAAEWAKANPKAAAIIRALANEQTTAIGAKPEEVRALRAEIDKMSQKKEVEKAHPDFETITSSDEFHDWAETQPDSVQALIYNGTSKDVIWALSQFKKELKTAKSNPSKDAARVVNKASSTAPEPSRKGRFTESQVARMTASEYATNAEAIEASLRDGSFVYDLSGAAR